MTCEELSDTDMQYFAVIANGEFIKTNALPTTPEPSDWLDLVDQAAANIFTWKFGVALALGLTACCAASCACRRCQRNRRHTVLQSKYRRQIIANRGVANGRKVRPPTNRPQPYAFPVRALGDPSHVGPGRFQESWRRPGPSSDHSRRSMRSGHSARGALLTGAGAVVPAGIDSEATTPPTPPHETCPECGLRLPDVVKLVNHVETHHGGRAIRKKEAAASLEAGATAGVETKVGGGGAKAGASRTESPVVAVAKDVRKASPPSREGRGSPNARAARASRSSSKTRSESPRHARHASAVRNSTAAVATAVGTVVVTAVPAVSQTRKKGITPAAEPPSRSYAAPAAASAAVTAAAAASSSKARSNSPGISGSGSGGSGSGRSGSSAKTRSSSPGSNDPSVAPTRGRDALPRLKDISGHGSSRHGLGRDQDSSGHGSGGESLPRVLSRVQDRGRSGSNSDDLPRILPRVKDGSGHGTSKGRKNSGSAGPSPAAPVRGSSRRIADVGAGGGGGGGVTYAASRLPGEKTEPRRGSRQEAVVVGSRGTKTGRNTSSPPLETGRSGDSGGGARGTSRERGRASADKEKSSEKRGRSRGRSRQRGPPPPAAEESRGLAREDSTRSLARTASLDRVSALSSRALTRSNRAIGNDPAAANRDGDAAVGGSGGGGGRTGGASGGGARGAAAREREQALHLRGIRRVASTEDMVPAGRRLTADRLKMLGSGLATEFTLSPPVFSPVKGSGKEPAYSPVARNRAAELDADRPVSMTRKFFRQLSGEL